MRPRVLFSALLLAACGGGGERPPNVLLISLDTVRADRLGCYGSAAGLTPNLDALAAGATRWERCAASAPWTVPSHASMFTGREPFAHGAVSFLVEDGTIDNVHPLADEHLTLAEALAAEGYATAGMVANAVYLNASFGLGQGFQAWRIARERAPRLNREALAWLDARPPDRPWLLFLNYMDAHRPYNVEPLAGERSFGPEEFSSALLDELYDKLLVERADPGPLPGQVAEQYDRAVRNLDRALGELFDALRERGLWDDTIVVVTADHGEYLGEHGLVEHSKDVYEEALAVPLIVKYAGQRAGRVEAGRASSAHLPRLVLDGLPPALAARHAAAFPLLPGGEPVIAENYYSRLRDVLHPALGERFHRVRSVLYEGEWKLIASSDGTCELYRLDQDPLEREDRAAVEPSRVERMRAALEARRAAGRFTPDATRVIEIDAERRREIEALGYGGGEGGDGGGDGAEGER